MGRIVSAAGLQVNPLNLTNLMHLNSHLGGGVRNLRRPEKPQYEVRQKLPSVRLPVCAIELLFFVFPPYHLSTAGGLCRWDIYSRNVFPALNIIDYFLFFGV